MTAEVIDAVAQGFAVWSRQHKSDADRVEAFAQDFPELVSWAWGLQSDDLAAWVYAHISLLIADGVVVSSKVPAAFPLAAGSHGSRSREDAARQIMAYLTVFSLTDPEERALLFSARGSILRYAALHRAREMGVLDGFYYLAGCMEDRAA